MKISDSIKILLEYKAVSDNDTNDEYRKRLKDSIMSPWTSPYEKQKYHQYLIKKHPNFDAETHFVTIDEPEKLNKERFSKAIGLDRANITKHNDELYDKSHKILLKQTFKNRSNSPEERVEQTAVEARLAAAKARLAAEHDNPAITLKNNFKHLSEDSISKIKKLIKDDHPVTTLLNQVKHTMKHLL